MKRVLSSRASWSAALIILATFAIAPAPPAALAKSPMTAKSFEGVWKVTKVVSPDGVVNANPQPGFSIFSRGYYSLVRDSGSGPRPQAPAPKDPAQLTDAEKLALYQEWTNFGAQIGTYEIKGDTLVTRAHIAKAVRAVGAVEQAIVRFDGDTFTAQAKPGEPNAGRVTTYTRVR
jgi:hypothetical protein